MRTKKGRFMKAMKKTIAVLLTLAALLVAVFLAGSYGWKLGGFHACQGAGITSVDVREDAVQITGFYPGSFPEGFCGYYARERDGKLYVGFRFSAVFGFFETGNFTVTIPVREQITEVVLKTGKNEFTLWENGSGFVAQTEQYGVYVKLEGNNGSSVSMAYDGVSGGGTNADSTALESGDFLFLDNDIMMAAKEAGAPVPFTITVTDADGSVVASGEFRFDAHQEKLYLTVTADGRIEEEPNETF